jgi:hypothetical protein
MGRWQREALTEGLWHCRRRPSTIRFADGPPPHGFATGRIYRIVIPAKGVQRHVTLKHDLILSVYRTGEIPAFAGMTNRERSGIHP